MGTRRRNRLAISLASALIVGLVTLLALRHRGPAADVAGAGALGPRRPTSNLTFVDPGSGRRVALDEFRDRSAVVLVFLGIDCPVAELYLPRLAELSRAYASRGVALLGINANAHDGNAEVVAHARRNEVPFPVLKDAGNRVADELDVDRMCEAFVLDRRRLVCYRGAIDDQYQVKARKPGPTVHYLAEAIDDVLAGRPVRNPTTQAFGCPIERAVSGQGQARAPLSRVRPAAPPIRAARERSDGGTVEAVEAGPVTFAEHVAPLLQEKCQSCHRPGQIGPFPLLTYAQVRRRATAIREAIADYRMPPWHADPHFGRFANDRSLTAPQRATLLAWIDGGTPEGDPAKLPPPKAFPVSWNIGTPDAIIEMPEPYTVQAEGVLPYQRFRVPTGFTEDRWVQAAEGRPGDNVVVHHIAIFVEPHAPDGARKRRTGSCLVTYAPGDMPAVYPPGVAKCIPAGSDLQFEVHYTPTGRTRIDRSSVALIFARGPVTHEAITMGIRPAGPAPKRLRIPPGAANHEVRASFTFPGDAHLLSFMPHMHLRGKDFRYSTAAPGGAPEVVLSIPAFDFGWQSVYRLAEPRVLPRGTRIECVAHYDNSAANPANPDPSATVTWGDNTWDEMMIGYIDFYFDAPHPRTRGVFEVD